MAISGMSAPTAALNAASRGHLGTYPGYGLAMRFAVTVDGLSLGSSWHSCKGLKVKLQSKPIEQGGEYTQATRLPERLSYEPITLERAVEPRDSAILQEWLSQYVRWWQAYPSARTGTVHRTDVTITLLDHQLSEVMKWTLRDAYPSSWSGPTLSADDNKVAIESLVLEHEGFLAV